MFHYLNYHYIHVIVLWTLLHRATHSAGILVHIEVLRQGSYTYGLPRIEANHEWVNSSDLPIVEWLDMYPMFSQAGSFFPDWGYGCLASDEDAELAHWPPFLGAAVEYLLETYPVVKASTPGQQLLTFILSVVAHQSTDASWHSIKFRNGLLRIMADLDFEGDYGAAHSILDIGGDTILAKEFAIDSSSDGFGHLSTSWSIPVSDIVEIYKRLGVSVNTLKLRYCMTRGFAAVSALRRVGSTLTARYSAQSPFMTTHMKKYFLGSIEEASTSVVGCWASLECWVSTGKVPTGNELWDLCEPLKTVGERGRAGPYNGLQQDLVHAGDQALLTSGDLFEKYADMIDQEMQHIRLDENEKTGILTIQSNHEYTLSGAQERSQSQSQFHVAATSYFLTPNIPYAEFGTSLAFIKSDQSFDLVVGSPKDTDSSLTPSRGAAYVIPVMSDALGSESSVLAVKQIRSSGHNGLQHLKEEVLGEKMLLASTHRAPRSLYFGKALVNVSVHGYQGIAILSSDKIEIFRMMNDSMEIEPHITILDQQEREQYARAPIASGIVSFERNGVSMLAVLSPWSGHRSQGAVRLFYLDTVPPGEHDLREANVRIMQPRSEVDKDLLRLGSSVAYSEKHDILFIGQAGSRSVLGYKIDQRREECIKLFEIFDPTPQELDSGFGSAVLSVNDLLYVSSPTGNIGDNAQVGIVRVYRMSPMYKKNSRQSTVPWVIRLIREISPRGDEPFSHFGTTLSATHTEGGVYISAPTYAGRGAVFYAAPIFPSLPRKSTTKKKSGLMALLDSLPFRPRRRRDLKLTAFNITLSPCLLGYDTNSRFGETVSVGDNGLVAIGAPTETGIGQYERKAGKVYLYDPFECT